MKLTSVLVPFLAGISAGIVLIVSCGDHTATVDAATCDCPAAEPPLAGRIVTIEGMVSTVAANQTDFAAAVCPVNSQIISGSCQYVDSSNVVDVPLMQFGVFPLAPNTWQCEYRNKTINNIPVDVKATATCLVQAH